MVTLYTTHCPRCKVLAKKLDAYGIEYETSEDVSEMLAKGLKSAPGLALETGEVLNFTAAIDWLNEAIQQKPEGCNACRLN